MWKLFIDLRSKIDGEKIPTICFWTQNIFSILEWKYLDEVEE